MSSKSPPLAKGFVAAPKDPEKERKKAEKIQKYNEKKAKAANAQATHGPSKTVTKKAKQDASKDEPLPPYVEMTTPGEKKSKCSHMYPQETL